ncbi:MAG: hypothetical protein ACTSWN_04625 [Promethearchaeota archaeon]
MIQTLNPCTKFHVFKDDSRSSRWLKPGIVDINMQAITHFFSGIFIFIFLQWLGLQPILIYALLFPLGILAHFIIDAFAKMTYHPPDALVKDKFWLTWHVIVYVGSVVVAIFFWEPYFWGMFSAIIPDIYDWVFIRGVRAYKSRHQGTHHDKSSEFMAGWEFHPLVDKFREKALRWMPNWNYRKIGIIPEILIWLVCILAIVLFF